jgi:hypothetical protein
MPKIGIDLGGTKIEAIALDGEREVFRQRIATPRGVMPRPLMQWPPWSGTLGRVPWVSAYRALCRV